MSKTQQFSKKNLKKIQKNVGKQVKKAKKDISKRRSHKQSHVGRNSIFGTLGFLFFVGVVLIFFSDRIVEFFDNRPRNLA